MLIASIISHPNHDVTMKDFINSAKWRHCTLCLLLLLSCLASSNAQVIVLPDSPSIIEKTAASTLQKELLMISGDSIPVISETEASKARKSLFRFHIGATKHAAAVHSGEWSEDEILIHPVKGGMVLTGHPGRGPIYAVNTLIEEGYGVRWWTSTEADYPDRDILPVPDIKISYAPPVKIREASVLDAYDADFRLRLKGNAVSRIRWATENPRYIPKDKGGCHRLLFFEGRKSAFHSFFEILPPKQYMDAHPEWYSMVKGQRTAKQLCLTNAEMEKAFIEKTLQLLRANPEVDFISISQNDWRGACECESCKALEAATGGVPSGPLVHFVNHVAEAVEREFPHVTIETFAYQYTKEAPKNVKPRHNVLIRLCDIECPFSMPLETADHPAVENFRNNLAEWTALAPGQVFVWDYVTDFHNYLLPHPNILNLGPNIRYFTNSGAIGIFMQGDTCSGAGELAPLRLWLIYHLLWNPSADDRALIEEFVRGYYGAAAAPDILRYISLINEPPAAGNVPVRCYHKDCTGWITPANIVAAARAMDRAAENAAKAGEPYASRVSRETLSTRHAILLHWKECKAFCKTQKIPWTWGDDPLEAAEKWISDCEAAGVRTIREATAEGAPGRWKAHCDMLLKPETYL